MAMNHFSYVRIINFQSVNHQQLLINYFPAQQTKPMIHHWIFGFTIPTAMALVQVRFPGQLIFQTNPILMLFMLCSIIAYSLAFSLELLLRLTPHADVVRPRNWPIASGSLSLTSLLSLLLSPPSSWPWLPLLLRFTLEAKMFPLSPPTTFLKSCIKTFRNMSPNLVTLMPTRHSKMGCLEFESRI